jgi:hypothetical protein
MHALITLISLKQTDHHVHTGFQNTKEGVKPKAAMATVAGA